MLKIKRLVFTTIFGLGFLATQNVAALSTNPAAAVNAGQEAPESAFASTPALAPPGQASAAIIPAAPNLNAKSYILMDANSGQILAAKDAAAHLAPASLTKIMSLYLAAEALKNGKLKFETPIPISEKAWRMEGSRLFAKVGSRVPAKELIDGIIIASGNDATVAIAEYLGGTEESFVDLMNKTAAVLNMKDTHFNDSNGLPIQNHYSSAYDLALLSQAFVRHFPEYYDWFKTKWITYNGIKQPNRNRLLWHDSSVDGIKTGHTEEAGFCLAASAQRNGMRLITVVLGAASEPSRLNFSSALLNYGFRFFETHKIAANHIALANAAVSFGKDKFLPVGVLRDLYTTLPTGQYKNLKVSLVLNSRLKAPLVEGQSVGMIVVSLHGQNLTAAPVVALKTIKKGNFFRCAFDKIKEVAHRL